MTTCRSRHRLPLAPLAAVRCTPPPQSARGASSGRHSRPGRLPLGDFVSAPRLLAARPMSFAAVPSSRRPSRLASFPASHPGPSSLSFPDAFSLGPSPSTCCVNDQLGLAHALSDPASLPRSYRPIIPAARAQCPRGRAGQPGHRHRHQALIRTTPFSNHMRSPWVNLTPSQYSTFLTFHGHHTFFFLSRVGRTSAGCISPQR